MITIAIPLQLPHSVFLAKTDNYVRTRPYYDNMSIRNMRRALIVNSHDYETYLDINYEHIMTTNKIAKKLGGRETMNFLRASLLKHCHDVRHNGPLKNNQHVFKDMIAPGEMHPSSGLDSHLKGQKIKLQILAADVEAMILIRCLEARLKAKGVIAEDAVLPDEADFYSLHPDAEDALISLRLAAVG